MKAETREVLRSWGEMLALIAVVFVLAGGYVANGCGTALQTCSPSTPAGTACTAPTTDTP